MLTYIARRILYSIPVLFLSSFLSFVFVSYAGNPLGNLRANPRIPPNTLRLVAAHNHLNDPVALRYFYWLKDFVTDKMGKSLLTFQPIWPDVHRTILHTAQVVIIAETLAIILFVDIYLKWHVRIFYTSGLNNIGQGTWSLDRLQHIALPVVTLCVVSFALYSRYMRASMLDVI